MTSDLLKVVGLLGVIGMIAFDVMSVRSKDRTLRQTLDSQASELESLRKFAAESKAYYEQAIEDSDQRRAKAKEKEDELTKKIASMEIKHRKELEEQKKREEDLQASFSKKLQEMEENLAQEKRVCNQREIVCNQGRLRMYAFVRSLRWRRMMRRMKMRAA